MSSFNCYLTLLEYKNAVDITSTDTTDDGIIEIELQAACRYIESKTNRMFYPRIRTRVYDIPGDGELRFKDDLLEVITLTNGDDTTIASTNYLLIPASDYPKYSLKLRGLSTVWWELDTTYGDEQVIDLAAVWGYHNNYAERGWTTAGTLGAAMSTTTSLTVTLTAGHSCVTGQIFRIGNELLNGSVSTNTLTALKRGDNGSTAALHDNGSTVYTWNTQEDVKEAALLLAVNLEKRRLGEGISSDTVATAGGIFISPRDVPSIVADLVQQYARKL